MTGCFLHVNPAPGSFLIDLGTSTDATGEAGLTLPLSDLPLLTGDLHLQWVFIDIGGNPLGVSTTRGMRSQIR